jgi:phosphate transport system substrate-binding protein
MKLTGIKVSAAVLLACVIFLSGCNQNRPGTAADKNAVKGTVSLSGAFALYPMAVKWAEEFMKVYPETRIDISAGGAGKGMTDALSGMVDMGMFSREVTQAEIDKGCWYIAVTKDAVMPTVNLNNPVIAELLSKGLTLEKFQEYFLTENPHYWEELSGEANMNKINVYTRSDACGAAEMWAKYLGKNQEGLRGIGVFGDPGMADAVKNDKYGIGYNNVAYSYDMTTRRKYPGLEVVPIDLNNNGIVDPEESFYGTLDEIMNAIQTGKYPSPPARDLYFVSKGKPSNPVAVAFLKWILTDGQRFVSEAGYVRLTDEKIKNELGKLGE